MELQEFLRQTQTEVRASGLPFSELAFSEIVMQHMADIGMTFEPELCHYQGKVGNSILRLSGYALSDDQDQLDLFVSLYEGVDVTTQIADSETKTAADQCLRFLATCANGTLASKLDQSNDIFSLTQTLQEIYDQLVQIRVFVLTDKIAKSKNFSNREIKGKLVQLEVMDIERLHRHWSEGKPRDELIVNFDEVAGTPLPCVYVPGNVESDYDYALTVIPGEVLRVLYEKFGARLLEANVRSFLSIRNKGVNAGIQNTLRTAPSRFIAYNNGIVIVADEIRLAACQDGSPGIAWLKGMQIVNGGQTTASIFFTKRKFPLTDLRSVRVPAKVIIIKHQDDAKEESLVSDISRFANSQNAVRQSDLSANKPFHVEVEKLSLSVYCSDGVSRWFYERAAGSYNTLLAREGNTPAKLRAIRESIPPSRKITKTDLAKYLNAWDKKPDLVSQGSQKNFDRFMAALSNLAGTEDSLPTVVDFKAMIAKTKIFRDAQKIVRPMFKAFQANITAYVVSVLSVQLGDRISLEYIWARQSISPEMATQISVWAREVQRFLHEGADGRMVSEWAKKQECRDLVLASTFSAPNENIPEIQ